jgi:excisionase family DNA binding protein
VSESPKTGSNGDLPMPEALLLTPEQAPLRLAICRTRIYELMGNGQLESVRIGSSRRIPAAALVDFVQRLHSASKVGNVEAEIAPFSVDRGRT